MGEFIWLMVYTVAMIVVIRWLVSHGTAPISQQAIRHALLQRLSNHFPTLKVLDEQEDELVVQLSDQVCNIHLDHLFRRSSATPGKAGMLIRQAVDSLVLAIKEAAPQPSDWDTQLMPLLLRTDGVTPNDLLLRPLTDKLVIGYVLRTEYYLRWVTYQMASDAQISGETMHDIAIRNLERSCNALVVETDNVDEDGYNRWVQFNTQDGFDAARVLIPSFFQRFAPRFADTDLLVAIPSRDSVTIISSEDRGMASLLSWRVGHEYARSAYPLFDHLLLIGEEGVIIPWPVTKPLSKAG